jgi:hypothetical protein
VGLEPVRNGSALRRGLVSVELGVGSLTSANNTGFAVQIKTENFSAHF